MRLALCLLLLLLLVAGASAQLNLSLQTSFTHPLFTGNGNIGVVMDSTTQTIWAVDFSNTVNLHHFDLAGNLLGSFPTNICTPPMSSPNGITQDRGTSDLWLVDNSSPASVLHMDLQGNCVGGWTFSSPSSNPVSIAHDLSTGTLLIGSDGQVSEWSLSGTQLMGGFPVTPVGGSTITSGLAWVPYSGNFIHAQSSGSVIWEYTSTGTQVSSQDMSTFGITNIQGLDYDPFTGIFLISDNSSTTFYVFNDLGFSPGGYALSLSQPAGSGTLQIDNTGLVFGREVFNVFSLEPCLTGLGTGPYLGLCASNVQTLIDQLLLPVGFVPFHFVASGSSASVGPLFIAQLGLIVEGVSFDIQAGGALGNISTVVQLVIL